MIYHLIREMSVDPSFQVIALALNEGVLSEKLKDTGIETHLIPESRYSLPEIFLASRRLFQGRGIGIIHSHRYKENLLGFLLARSLGIRGMVTTVHGATEQSNGAGISSLRKASLAINRWILRRHFSDIVVVSKELHEILTVDLGRTERVHVIYNGIGKPCESGYRVSSRRKGLHIGTVGRMVPVKNFFLFLELAREVRKKAGDTRFSILGDGPMKADLVGAANDMGLQEAISFLPPVADPFDYYGSLDIYVNTSKHEGMPMSIIEAMSCGLPVIAFQVGGIPEIITHGEDGLLGIPMRLQEILGHSMQLIDNEEMRARLGRNAMRTVKDRFTSARMAEGYSRLYERIS
jgi:glycosyltransferase involved in cell wall biosynthesis